MLAPLGVTPFLMMLVLLYLWLTETEEAKLSAQSALVAIEGVAHEPELTGGEDDGVAAGKHIMVSCECAASSIKMNPPLTNSGA